MNTTLYDGALCVTASHGYTEILSILLQSGTGINSHQTAGRHALYVAILQGHEEVVTMLLNAGSRDMELGHDTKSLLEIAVARGDEELCQKLLEAGIIWGVRKVFNMAIHYPQIL